MHEVGLMQAALDVALEHAARDGASRIRRLTVRVGKLSGVVPEALRFAFEAVTHGTIAEGGVLEIEAVTVVCHCRSCDASFEPEDVIYVCPRCGRVSAELRQGRELELVEMEVS